MRRILSKRGAYDFCTMVTRTGAKQKHICHISIAYFYVAIIRTYIVFDVH